MTSASKFSVGDRAVHVFWGAHSYGKIVKLFRKAAEVHFDSGKEERVGLESLHREIPADIARRDHEIAMDAWQKRQPSTQSCLVVCSWLRDSLGVVSAVGAQVNLVKSPAEMREAAAELLQLADWFAEKPPAP